MNLACHKELFVLTATWDITEVHKHRSSPGGVSSNLISCQNKSAFFPRLVKMTGNADTRGGCEIMACVEQVRLGPQEPGELILWFIPSENVAGRAPSSCRWPGGLWDLQTGCFFSPARGCAVSDHLSLCKGLRLSLLNALTSLMFSLDTLTKFYLVTQLSIKNLVNILGFGVEL